MQVTFALESGAGVGERIDLPDAEVFLHRPCLPRDQADALLNHLIHTVDWRQETLTFAGRQVPVPRLQAWYGDSGTRYRYSGLQLDPLPWTEALQSLRTRVEVLAGTRFNSVLVNYYRDGNDSVSWHSDNEAVLGSDPIVASLSLGATRRFQLKHRRRSGRPVNCELSHGSLLIMGSGVQRYWRHRVPKQPRVTDPRINLTFRWVDPART